MGTHLEPMLVFADLDPEPHCLFTGRPARALSNRLTRELAPLHEVTPGFPTPMLVLASLRRKGGATVATA